MRAPAALAAIALAGTVLLGGAGQALADDKDEMSNAGTHFGATAPALPDINQNASEYDQEESRLGQVGSILNRIVGSR
jgi:hypothetical protein